jgi:hypothetical protein
MKKYKYHFKYILQEEEEIRRQVQFTLLSRVVSTMNKSGSVATWRLTFKYHATKRNLRLIAPFHRYLQAA